MTCSIVHCAAHKQILIKPYLNIIKKNREKNTPVSPILQQLQIIRVQILPKEENHHTYREQWQRQLQSQRQYRTTRRGRCTYSRSTWASRRCEIARSAIPPYTRGSLTIAGSETIPQTPCRRPCLKSHNLTISQSYNPPISQSLHPHTLTSPNPVNPQCLVLQFAIIIARSPHPVISFPVSSAITCDIHIHIFLFPES